MLSAWGIEEGMGQTQGDRGWSCIVWNGDWNCHSISLFDGRTVLHTSSRRGLSNGSDLIRLAGNEKDESGKR